MSVENPQIGLIGPSMEFFAHPESYRRFSTTRDNKRIIACIDPRLPGQVDSKQRADIDDLKVTIQTDGGAIGLGHDRALKVGIETMQPISVSEGIISDAKARQANVLDAHRSGCRFLDGIVIILDEEAEPSDFTSDAFERWEKMYRIGLTNKNTQRLRDAARVQAELQTAKQESELIYKVVNELHPEHPNVRYMSGENRASLHVVNHHPLVGVDRRLQAKQYGDSAQAYHNNLAAIVERSLVLPDLSPRGRQLRAGAAIMRAAATRTVLMAGHDDSQFLEIFCAETETGLRFEELKT